MNFTLGGSALVPRKPIARSLWLSMKPAKSGDESAGEQGEDHFPIERFFICAMLEDLLRREVSPIEIRHDLVIALAVHALMHGFRSLNSKAAIVGFPGLAVHGVGVDDHAVHIENQSADSIIHGWNR